MPVIGLSFDRVEANKEKAGFGGEIKVNSTPRVVSMKEVSVPTLNKKALSLSFEFLTQYNPGIGEIKISGEMLYLAKKNEDVLKLWKSKKKIPEDMSVEVLNHLFRRCLLKIANIAEDLQLPPPIAMPKVRPKGEEAGYIG